MSAGLGKRIPSGSLVRSGIGGWTYEPWRGTFFPPKLPHARELEYASRQLTTIEINGTFYRTQTRATFEKWAAETPDAFVFSVKAPRYAVNRKVLGEASESIQRFVESGIAALGDKLGPILWQFAGTKKFEAEDFAAFLSLLPREAEGRALTHVLEPRHASFDTPAFRDLVARHNCAVVVADADDYPNLGDGSGPVVYARLQRCRAEIDTGYAADALDAWGSKARAWAEGGRSVHVLFISGAKERAPAAAMALLARL